MSPFREIVAHLLELPGSLIEALPDAVLVVEQTGAIVLVNAQAERLFGYTRNEMVGQPIDIVIPERLRPSHHGHFAEYLRAASVRPMAPGMDLWAARCDGGEFPVEISLGPFEAEFGTLVICAIRDVTVQRAERARTTTVREANERLVITTVHAQIVAEEAEKESHFKDEFLSTLSHELRTPLNAILGWARLLASKRMAPDRADHAVAAIERSGAALAQMIEDLLDVARIGKGVICLTLKPVDLPTVAATALDVLRPLAAARNVRLTLEAAPDVPAVNGDAGRLQQIIGNLLANAIKFTPSGGCVRVVIEVSNKQVEVRVVDTGNGISADLLPHVFERFRQADDASTQRHSGLGLGLSIVLDLVELHGGTVDATSDGLGQGATFRVRLPIAPADGQAGRGPNLVERRTTSLATSPMPRLQRLDGLRILLVDDHADGRALTALVLTQAGASVKAVTSAREALQCLAVERPDALVSDIDLPDQDGYALVRRVRQYEAEHGGRLPAIALTGYARAEDRDRAIEAGFQAHTPKPVEPAALTAAIAAMIATGV